MKLLEVLIEYKVSALNTPFSYVCDDLTNVEVGCRVYVPFGAQNIVAYVIKVVKIDLTLEQLIEKTKINYKYIYQVIDLKPILNDELFSLANFMANQYVCPLISCLQTILPPSYKPLKQALKKINDKVLKKVFINEFADIKCLNDSQKELYNLIKESNGIYLKDLPIARIKTLEKHNIVKIVDCIANENSLDLYQGLEKKIKLNDEQTSAFNKIINSNDKNIFLLQGVTGSGKTEVYMELVDYYLRHEKSAIILVPEISLTPMIIQRFKQRFDSVAILHGSLSAKEKQIQYDMVKDGKAKVVIGARSAIFAPLKNIGIIILDEEQSTSYKQDKSPTYHARDIAIYRAKQHNAKVVLGSATPSFETKARAIKGVYEQVYIKKRANNATLPYVDIIDMKDQMSDFSPLISYPLDYEIQNCLDNNNKLILLQNRRGYAPYVSCRKCGYVFKCPNCELPTSYHRNGNKFKCHYCNYEINFENKCPSCGNDQFLFMGSGTQKIEEIIEKRYPKAKILRMDNDTTSIKNGHMKILDKFQNEDYNILLGTQMVAKGLDFHDVTLVGVINADLSLSSADFRSNELTFELLSQVAGRAGRGQKEGRVIIQTFNPDHYAIVLASMHMYDNFYKKDMEFRYRLKYPPFSYLCSLTVLSAKSDQACILADRIHEYLSKYEEFELLGPAMPYVFKENDRIKVRILVKSKNRDLIIQTFNKINIDFQKESLERKCSIIYDIDTYNLL